MRYESRIAGRKGGTGRALVVAGAFLVTMSGSPCEVGAAGTGPSGAIPAAVDLTRTKYFPPAALQGKAASCDWFACAYYQMTYMNNRAMGRAAAPSNTFSPKFGFTLVNNGKLFPENLWFMDVYDLLQAFGSPFVADLPYDLAGGEHCAEWRADAGLWTRAAAWRIAGYEYLLFDLARVKALLAAGDVLVVQCNPWKCELAPIRDLPGAAGGGHFAGESAIAAGPSSPDHTVALVGYDDAIWVDRDGDGKPGPDEMGAFLVAESAEGAGTKDGHRWISYAAASRVLFENKVWRITVRGPYRPRVLAEVTLSASDRGNLKMEFGRGTSADPASLAESAFRFDPPALGFRPGRSGRSLIAGAGFSFAGTPGPGAGSFAFDLTDMVTEQADHADFWFFRLRNDGKEKVAILSFRIVDAERGAVAEDRSLPVSFAEGERLRVIRHPRASRP